MSLLNMQILSFSQIKNESYFIYAVVGLILSVPADRKKLNELDIHLMWSFLKQPESRIYHKYCWKWLHTL